MWMLILAILGFASATKLGQNTGHHDIGHARTPGFTSDPESSVVRVLTVNGIVTFDNHACIFQNGEVRIRGTPLGVGESGNFDIEAGFATLETGERVNIGGGLINVRVLPSASTQPISNSLARAGLTLDEFIQQTGTFPPQQGILDITAGVISFNGNLKNVISGVLITLAIEFVEPTSTGETHPSVGHAGTPGFTSDPESSVVRLLAVNGIITFDNHACIFQNGEVRIRGTPLGIGESGNFDIEAGFATLGTGERVNIGGGLMNVRVLTSTSIEPISNSLARAGLTLDEFIQQTGTFPPQQGILDITAGVVSFNGNLKNVISGVMLVLSIEFVEPTGTGETQPPVGLATEVRTVTVTETAAHETETVFEPVTLTKTQTRDEFATITSPVYNSLAATITNLVKQTVTVPEEQVIRSPIAGSVVVNTIPVPSQTVLTVSVRNTNMFVQTVTDEVTYSQIHFVTNYSISTATVINPVTSTVVHIITQTRVSSVYNTSTVGSTVYTTTTSTVNIGTAGATETAAPGGYY